MDRATLIARLRPLLAEHGIRRASLFGSRARGDERPDSDVDVLVEFTVRPGLIAFIGIEQALSDALGLDVRLVERSALRPDFQPSVYRDEVAIA